MSPAGRYRFARSGRRSLDVKLNDRGMVQRNLCAFQGRFYASKF
nr:hypothetical protein [Enterobacter roggenkampii]